MITIPNSCNALVLREKDALNNFYKIVKVDHFYRDSIILDVEGCVISFKVNNPKDQKNHNKTFILLDREDLNPTNEFYKQNNLPKGFYEENTFYKYHQEFHDYYEDVNMNDLILSRYTDFIEATSGDNIFFKHMIVEKEANGQYGSFPAKKYYKTKQHIKFYDGTLLQDNELGVPDIEIYGGTEFGPYYSISEDDDTDVLFYESNIYQANIEGLSEIERYKIAKAVILIAVNIYNIKKEIFPLLPSNNTLIQLIISQQIAYWQTPNFGIFDGISPEEIVRYRSKINLFYNQAKADKIVIDQETGLRSLWRLLGCLDSQSIATLSIELRIEFLWIIAKLKKLDDPIFKWEPVNMESVVRNIVWSVNETDANLFLDALLIEPDSGSNITVFQYIFDETNDIGFAPDALRDILDHLCFLWLHSKYAYYENGIPPNSFDDSSDIGQVLLFMNIDPTEYNESRVTATEYSNKALVLNYKSEEFLWFFHDTSHDFVMSGDKIVVFKDAPKSSAFPYEYNKTKVYHMYQGVSVAMNENESSDELKLKFQQFSINGQTSAILPIFYLAYVDYNKTVENYVTAVEIALDTIFTISGVGNLLKLRHLFKLTKLGRMALTGESIAETIFIQLAKATFEIAPTVAQYYVEFQMTGHQNYCDISSPNYDPGKCAWYREFSQFLVLIQIKAGVIEGAHQLMIRKAAKNLVNDVDNIPVGFNMLALDALRMFAYDLEALEHVWKERLFNIFNTYNSNIWQKYIALADEETKIAFILDFEDAGTNALNKLNWANGSLVDEWDEITVLFQQRHDVEFLLIYRKIKNAEILNEEVFEGIIAEIDNAWAAKGAHYKSAFISEAEGGFVRIVRDQNDQLVKEDLLTLVDSNGDSYTYYKAKVEMYHQDYTNPGVIDPNTGQPTKFKRKKKASTFFPDEWSKQRVREEISLAYMNKEKIGKNTYKGTMSDGVKCTIYTDDNGLIVSAHPSFN